MADMYSVRLGEEEREKLGRLVNESGLSGKEFFSELLSAYELQKAKTSAPFIAEDIKELEVITRRINSIYVNVVERVNSLSKASDEQMQHIQKSYEKQLADLRAENQRLIIALDNFEKENALITERANKLELEITDTRALVDIKKLVEQLKMDYVPNKKVSDRLST